MGSEIWGSISQLLLHSDAAGVRYGHVLNPEAGCPVNYMAVSIIGEFCVVVGSAPTIGMLEGEEKPEWPSVLGLSHLWINVQGESSGVLME